MLGVFVRPRYVPSAAIFRGLTALAVLITLAFVIAPKIAADPAGFVVISLNGLTAASLYFVVAAGFTLVFGLMRVTNLAHGSLYLLGGYIGYSVKLHTGSWALAVGVASIVVSAVGLALHQGLMRWVTGDDLREALITVGFMIVVADQALAIWGSEPLDIGIPNRLDSVVQLPGSVVFSAYRLAILALALIVGAGLWLLLNRTRIGLAIRAGVDDRGMVSALGVNVQLLFAGVFSLGAFLAGFAGVVGGSYLSIARGEDARYLLMSLVVVIVGGMGSVPGAALGAVLIGLVEAYSQVYASTYSVLVSFGVMVLVLAVRPQGLLGRAK